MVSSRKFIVVSIAVICIALVQTSLISFNTVLASSGLDNQKAYEEQIISQDEIDSLRGKADTDGSVRLIVHLNSRYDPELATRDTLAAKEQMNALFTTQKALLDSLSSENVVDSYPFKYVPFMVLETNQQGLGELLKSPLVLGINEDRLSDVFLDSSLPVINADDAHDLGYTGSGQTVAILDTGVDKNHPDLAGHVVSEACYSTNNITYNSTSLCPGAVAESTAVGSALPYTTICPAGECDHGTHVAAIAAGEKGVAPDANIIAIQVFSYFDNTTYCGTANPCTLSYDSDQIKALERVYELYDVYDIAAVNLSLGGGYAEHYCDNEVPVYKTAIDLLSSVGITTVVASGNEGYLDGVSYPACISSAVSVGATYDSDEVAGFSNSNYTLDLLAPGVFITAAIPNDGYATMNGTSMATPHVAGAFTILKSAYPGSSSSLLESALKQTGVLITDVNSVITPRIDVSAALAYFASTPSAINATSSISPPVKIIVSWEDSSDNEVGYQIERKLSSEQTWQIIANVDSGENVISFIDQNIDCETHYDYRVSTRLVGGGFSEPSTVASTRSLLCSPETVAKIYSSQESVVINWTDSSGVETGYKLERSDYNVDWFTVNGDLPANSTRTMDHVLDQCQVDPPTFYYRVRALEGTSFNYSEVISASPIPCGPPPPPENLQLSLTGVNESKLTWQDVLDDEDSYQVERKIGDQGNWERLTNNAGLPEDTVEYIDSNLIADSVFYYRIFAVNEYGESNPSDVVSGSTIINFVYLPVIIK